MDVLTETVYSKNGLTVQIQPAGDGYVVSRITSKTIRNRSFDSYEEAVQYCKANALYDAKHIRKGMKPLNPLSVLSGTDTTEGRTVR